MSTSSRTRGSSMPAIVSIAARAAAESGVCWPWISSNSTRSRSCSTGSSCAQQRFAGLADRQPHTRGARPGARRAAAGAGTRGARPRCGARVGLIQSSRLAPTMLTLPPTASSPARRASTSASVVAGNDRHSCPGSSSITGATPSATMPDGDVGCRALGADHVGRPVEGGCRQRPAGGQRFVVAAPRGADRARRGRSSTDRGRRRRMPRHPASAIARCGTAARAGRRVRSAGTG